MATAAQIAANQRNALKSTGPKTREGKQMSSVNARRHGLHSALPVKDVLAAYEIITGQKANDLTRISGAALRLAIAEAQLARVRESERSLLERGDDNLRNTWFFDMIEGHLKDELAELGRVTDETNFEAAVLKIRGIKAFGRSTRQAYRSLLRALRQAENAHAAALDEWLGQV